MSHPPAYLRVAVPTPLRRLFDYLPPLQHDAAQCQVGCRVRVPFGRQKLVGIIVAHSNKTDQPTSKLKRAQALLDDSPLLDSELLELLNWACQYYQHPIGDVIASALPTLLRQGRAATREPRRCWQLTATGKTADIKTKRAVKQAMLLNFFNAQHDAVADEIVRAYLPDCSDALKRLVEKGWIECVERDDVAPLIDMPTQNGPLTLTQEQRSSIERITASTNQFQVFLLDGITGSGKTEVYLQCINAALRAQRQILVLVPEIGLTPQLLQRFTARLGASIAVWHSGLSDSERLQTWLSVRDGSASVIIGTRSAVFLPLRRPGLIVIDEEHDASFKQQDGFRYSARDLAIMRARRWQIPVVLGSATPALETLANVERQRYVRLVLSQRAGGASLPKLHILDVRKQPMDHGLSHALRQRMGQHLQADGQVLLFLNRRGYAPTLLCHECGWIADCARCDSHMTYHHSEHLLRCHHCGAQRRKDPVCPTCKSAELVSVGIGTERLERALQHHCPDTPLVRIDRDTTRRKGSLDVLLEKIHTGQPQILIGTQMLAKGHHFPNVTLVGIIDTDQGLYSADFRATERMAQQILQVSGRAGRAERPGEVFIQTHHPEHPLLHTLIARGYHAFALELLTERQQAGLPPYTSMALLRAESVHPTAALTFLQQLQQLLQQQHHVALQIYGPIPSPMEKRAGKIRAQLILIHPQRAGLQQALQQLLTNIDNRVAQRKVRWSVDVDPIDTY